MEKTKPFNIPKTLFVQAYKLGSSEESVGQNTESRGSLTHRFTPRLSKFERLRAA
jgi:hypothetical protein